jgi:hypothetical protein
MMTKEETAYRNYLERTGEKSAPIAAALIDMDGVLYDSMPNHAKAWEKVAAEQGWNFTPEEFYLYEGMTGDGIIRLLMKREKGRTDVTDEESRKIYASKVAHFSTMGPVNQIDGTAGMLNTLRDSGIQRVLVTGSGQNSLIDRLNTDYPGIFSNELRVTGYDVKKGKPDPEPYLMGLQKAHQQAGSTIVIENAPLGVRAGHASGCFTVGITTGPIPAPVMYENGADIVYPTMRDFAAALPSLIELRKRLSEKEE